MRETYATRSSANKMERIEDDNFGQFDQSSSIKRPATLDLNNEIVKSQAKKAKFSDTVNTTLASSILTTPDVQNCKFNTPELEYLALEVPGILQTPTNPPAGMSFGTNATLEQEDYARGFEEALKEIKSKNNKISGECSGASSVPAPNSNAINNLSTTTSSMITGGMSGGTISFANLDDSVGVSIKDEPQSMSNSPPSPIDMESQERIKLERKRQRNRVAASKCRKRKLERISRLEDRVKCLKGENFELAGVVKQLKENVCQLKQQVMGHLQSGCSIPLYNATYFNSGITA